MSFWLHELVVDLFGTLDLNKFCLVFFFLSISIGIILYDHTYPDSYLVIKRVSKTSMNGLIIFQLFWADFNKSLIVFFHLNVGSLIDRLLAHLAVMWCFVAQVVFIQLQVGCENFSGFFDKRWRQLLLMSKQTCDVQQTLEVGIVDGNVSFACIRRLFILTAVNLKAETTHGLSTSYCCSCFSVYLGGRLFVFLQSYSFLANQKIWLSISSCLELHRRIKCMVFDLCLTLSAEKCRLILDP